MAFGYNPGFFDIDETPGDPFDGGNWETLLCYYYNVTPDTCLTGNGDYASN